MSGISKKVVTTSNGEFWRVIVPGKYNISASWEGLNGEILVSESVSVTVGTWPAEVVELILS